MSAVTVIRYCIAFIIHFFWLWWPQSLFSTFKCDV